MNKTPYISRYEHRIELVKNVIEKNSTLSKDKSSNLAVLVLHAIDHVPETVR